MAKAFQSAVVRITLELTGEEANYLKGFIQNSPYEIETEPANEKSIRHEIFSALFEATRNIEIK